MELPAVGRVENTDELDLDPIVIPVVGYTLDKQEVEHKVRFRPMQPAGPSLDAIRETGPNGELPVNTVLMFLEECVLDDARGPWREFLHRPDVELEQQTLIRLYEALISVYATRPTRQRSDSQGGSSSTKETSRAAARSRASAGKKRASRSRSTSRTPS